MARTKAVWVGEPTIERIRELAGLWGLARRGREMTMGEVVERLAEDALEREKSMVRKEPSR